MTLNPYLHTASQAEAVLFPAPPRHRPILARLPEAPVTGSPVPELTSLWHNPDPGSWGNRSYPGNCSGTLIHALLRYYRPRKTYDPMSGSGTCREVCEDLGIECVSGDIHHGFDACEPHYTEAFDFCWIHPPYWRMKLYSSNPKDLSREPTLKGFLHRYEQLIHACAQALTPGGHLVVLMGDYTDRKTGYTPLVFHTKEIAFRIGLQQAATDIIRFSHGSTSSRKQYRSRFIPGLHDVACIFQKPQH